MNRAFRIIAASYLASLGLAVAAALLGKFEPSLWLSGFAVLVSGTVFAGHLITLDEDSPGGWSNPDGASDIWASSLRELALKFGALLLAVGVLVFGFASL